MDFLRHNAHNMYMKCADVGVYCNGCESAHGFLLICCTVTDKKQMSNYTI